MNPYFGDNPATLTIAIVTVLTWVVLERVQDFRHRGGGKRQDRGSYLLLVFCILATGVVALLSTTVPSLTVGGQPVPFVVGVVLAWGGIVLRAASFRALGRYFTFHVETRPHQPVIATGPYRVLRHPSYTGLWLTLVGLALMCGTWVAVVAAVLLPGIGLAVRIRVEERALEAELGEAYRAFAATRKRLIPFVW
ncbi:MAG: isoprenylcysteine carboxylmethyltransferase family protein [Rhodoglobus sp.]